MPKGLLPLNKNELALLANYNSEESRGIVHTLYWQGKMAYLQKRFNLVGFERPEKRSWWKKLLGG